MKNTSLSSEKWVGEIDLFLVGGPAFSGTTLLAHLLNQENVICLDEPDFHNPRQRHRAIPFLKELFPDKRFPEVPEEKLAFQEAIELIQKCQEIIEPVNLGFKTCNWAFIEYAKIFKNSGFPVIAIVRDIRDALVRPLPSWETEKNMNRSFRMVWKYAEMFDLSLRYEDLVDNPGKIMLEISRLLSCDLKVRQTWEPDSVHCHMFKLDRHELLRKGHISTRRVGIWRNSGKNFSGESHETAKMMGY